MESSTSASAQQVALIVGAGHAGSEAAISLRQNGYAGRILLAGDEPHLPYHRPPLSKAYLQGAVTADALLIRPRAAYEKADIELLPGTTVLDLDLVNRTAAFSDGTTQPWNQLILATGSRPRALPASCLEGGGQPANLHYLRSLADATALAAQLLPGRRLVIVGGGYIGLEVAASAIKLGVSVTVLEAQPRVLARVTAAEVSAFYERIHRDAGVDIRIDAQLERFQTDDNGNVRAVLTTRGESIDADLVLVGVGALPNTELAERAGLRTDNGIVVDESNCAAAPGVHAIGDCCSRYSSAYGRHLRLESVPNAMEQARIAAAAITGKPAPAIAPPWFWSDQYDLKLQIAGLNAGYDQVVLRGSPDDSSFVAFYLQAGRIIAADCVNRATEFAAIKKLVQQRSSIPAPLLADPGVVLKALLETAA